jgi:hypothetical protein
MRILQSPAPLDFQADQLSLFLAGSIELGKADDWQQQAVQGLSDLDILLLNPRRASWDASIAQSLDNPIFREQVEWELAAQERADIVSFYFAPNTQAPITLLEFGFALRRKRMIVCCPEGYWRKGNIDVACARYGIKQVATLEELIATIREECTNIGGGK